MKRIHFTSGYIMKKRRKRMEGFYIGIWQRLKRGKRSNQKFTVIFLFSILYIFVHVSSFFFSLSLSAFLCFTSFSIVLVSFPLRSSNLRTCTFSLSHFSTFTRVIFLQHCFSSFLLYLGLSGDEPAARGVSGEDSKFLRLSANEVFLSCLCEASPVSWWWGLGEEMEE